MQHPHAVNRESEPEAGFTLIELMMVVLIIAILIAVLIPTFVGAKQRAQDRAMQSSMRNALTAARVVYSDHGDYTEATTAGLAAVEPSLTFVAAGAISPGPNVVSVNPASATYIVHGRAVAVGNVLLPGRRRERRRYRCAVRQGRPARVTRARLRPRELRVGHATW